MVDCEGYQRKKVNIDLSPLKRLGIDEITLHKGHEDYIVVFTDLDRRIPIGFAPSRKHIDLQKVVQGWGNEVLEQIEEVSIDLSGNYKGFVQKWMPNAEIVADRFHVAKIVNQELNEMRNTIRKSNQSNPNLTEKAQVEAALKQSKYALLKPEENLTEKQSEKLQEIREAVPALAQMHQQKEAFRHIFESASDWTEGLFQLLDWLVEAQTTFPDSVATIARWFGEVLAYFNHHTTSGVVEGINNKLKLIKRSGYGFNNFGNFVMRCLICWHLADSQA